MHLYSLEQLEVLMLVAESENPVKEAVHVRKRWRYILGVAKAAQLGIELDGSLPQVLHDSGRYVTRAESIISVLDEWLEQRAGRPLTDLN